MPDLLQMLDTAAAAVRAAGDVIRARRHERRTFETKTSYRDLVTAVDKAVEAEVMDRLRAAYPDHGLVGEEGTSHVVGGTQPIWYLDPVDGTTNFIAGLPHICVSLACYQGTEALVAVVYNPDTEELYTAARGHGAYLNGARLRVDDAPDLQSAVVASNSLLAKERTPAQLLAMNNLAIETRGLRCLGAAALDLAYVAAGRMAGFFQFRLSPWDLAAGALLVTEAGGRVSQPDGAPLDVASSNCILATNGTIHEALVAALRPALPQ